MKGLFCVVALSALTGCASIVSGQNQSISLEARAAGGEPLVGAICNLKNDKGEWFITSPGSTTVRRSYENIGIRCEKDSHEAGLASVASATKGMAYGNLLFGGVIGAGVDIGTGAAYDYPPLVTVTMGKTTMIGSPPPATGPGAKTPADIAQERIDAARQPAIASAPAAFAAIPTLPPIAAPVAAPAPPPAPVAAPPAVVAPSIAPAAPPAPVRAVATAPTSIGNFSFQAEQLPAVRACNAQSSVSLVATGNGVETYSARCASGDVLAVRCEFGNCRVLR